jgi:4'-phosphopantetheinyl transferase EntD
MNEPFTVAFEREHPFGVLVGVTVPADGAPVPESVLLRLLPQEQAAARALRGFRQAPWVGARLAFARVASRLGCAGLPLLNLVSGAPFASPAVVVSVTHKGDLAVVLAARLPAHGVLFLGVDLEGDATAAAEIAALVFDAEERARFLAMPQDERARAQVAAFSYKESVYKALAPGTSRILRYDEASVEVHPTQGHASIRLRIAELPEPSTVDTWHEWQDARVLTAVRIVSPADTPPAIGLTRGAMPGS